MSYIMKEDRNFHIQSVLTRYHLHTFAGQISSVCLMPNIVLRIDSVELFAGILFKK